MSWIAFFLAVAAAATNPGGAAPDSVSGRCRDGRIWTTSLVEQGQMLGLLNEARADEARPPLRRHAVLEEEHDLVGVGMVRIQGSRYGTYWAVEFAAEGRY